MKDLENRIIVITGANSGIGYAIAEQVLAAKGTSILVGRNIDKLMTAHASLGGRSTSFKADVTSLVELDALYSFVKEKFGRVDGVVANAGEAILEDCTEVTETSFDHSMDTNLKGAFFTAQKALPLMQHGGSIVFNASLAAHRPFKQGSIYAATKAALKSLASAMALELGQKNIRVNSISPGNIITPIFEKLGLNEQEKIDFINFFKEKVPLGRSGTPNEIAETCIFLLSEASSYITGTDILVDGGLLLST